jgi:CubicO group peptidase (beta-lactamase class C family)
MQSAGRVPSMVAGVVRDGALVWSGGRGDFAAGVDWRDVQYRIGSITKTLVAVAVMRLRDEGLLSLNDPLDRHVPGSALGSATVAQLLSHTGGAAAELPGSWWERSPGVDANELERRLSQGALVDRVGRRFHYSNPGFALLGELVARLRGRDWWDVVTQEVCAPLGMTRTGVEPVAPFAQGLAVHPYADVVMPEVVQDTKAMGPAGQVWSILPDLARWAAFVAGDTGGVLSADTLEEMRQPVVLADRVGWKACHGLGFQVFRDKGRVLVGHGGSMPGFQAGLQVDVATGTGVVSMLNCTTPSAVTQVEDPFELMDECEPVVPPTWSPMPQVSRELLALTGPWFWGTSQGVLRVESDGWLKLETVSGMVSTSRFRPNGDGTFTGVDSYYADEVLRVVRDESGTVTHLDVGTFVFTREVYAPPSVVPGGAAPGGWPVELGACEGRGVAECTGEAGLPR